MNTNAFISQAALTILDSGRETVSVAEIAFGKLPKPESQPAYSARVAKMFGVGDGCSPAVAPLLAVATEATPLDGVALKATPPEADASIGTTSDTFIPAAIPLKDMTSGLDSIHASTLLDGSTPANTTVSAVAQRTPLQSDVTRIPDNDARNAHSEVFFPNYEFAELAGTANRKRRAVAGGEAQAAKKSRTREEKEEAYAGADAGGFGFLSM